MRSITKLAEQGVKSGLNLYAMDKITNAAGQMAINFLPAAVPTAASVLLGGLAVALGLETLGKGAIMKESADFALALAFSNALTNVPAIDGPVSKMTNQIAAIGMSDADKAAYLGTTAGYAMQGYAPAPAMAGGRVSSLRGYTSRHGF